MSGVRRVSKVEARCVCVGGGEWREGGWRGEEREERSVNASSITAKLRSFSLYMCAPFVVAVPQAKTINQYTWLPDVHQHNY
ncbi:hypothetical protein E2C01_061776 [Portunus trituberculatus]|uniref:Uncharacterized protein n=1 Tax=Portunus trituberculatus TaxID=210409 RepID=A0A5B7HCS4_PORTR|nr:hypothetical protein [Portunus trituberculatus]